LYQRVSFDNQGIFASGSVVKNEKYRMCQDPYRKYANWKTKTQDESDLSEGAESSGSGDEKKLV
jgi:hypothetical protein